MEQRIPLHLTEQASQVYLIPAAFAGLTFRLPNHGAFLMLTTVRPLFSHHFFPPKDRVALETKVTCIGTSCQELVVAGLVDVTEGFSSAYRNSLLPSLSTLVPGLGDDRQLRG